MIQLVDPANRAVGLERLGDRLRSTDGRHEYPIVNGIPRFTAIGDAGQAQTARSFGYKWLRNPDWGLKPETQRVAQQVFRDFYGWTDPDDLKRLMEGRLVLNAGCGAGTEMQMFAGWPATLAAVDISTAIDHCRQQFGDRPNVEYFQADLNALPFPDESFDVVWSHGVLHHTPDTFTSARSLAKLVKRGGLFILYVYRKKGPIREFVDDYLRKELSPLDPETAWAKLEPLTELARNLSRLNVDVVVEHDIPELGIRSGTYPVQRLIYQHIMKCFWNEGLSFDENVHVNFDWYHPEYAHRQTVDEVREWMPQLGFEAQSIHESDSGIAVIARKSGPTP
jgi:SAM-dependent methyltransferase